MPCISLPLQRCPRQLDELVAVMYSRKDAAAAAIVAELPYDPVGTPKAKCAVNTTATPLMELAVQLRLQRTRDALLARPDVDPFRGSASLVRHMRG